MSMAIARPSGIQNRSYEQEFIIVRTKTQWAFLLLGLAFLFTLPLYSSSYIINVTNQIGITLIAAFGLHIAIGYCGLFSIGQSAFMAVGAYINAILIREAGFSFWAALPCAALVTGIAGVIAGLPSLRIKGFYLSMATLAAQFIIPWIFGHFWTPVTGGMAGLTVPAINIFGKSLLSQEEIFFVIWPIAIFGIYFATNLMRTKTGRAFMAIRDNDLAAEVMGIDLFRNKLLAFFICSVYAGVAGALWSEWMRSINPDQFNLSTSIQYLGMMVIGGVGSNAGVVFGVIFLVIIDEITRSLAPLAGVFLGSRAVVMAPAFAPLIFGVVILLFLIYEPRGLAHLWQRFKASYRLNPFSY